MLVPCGNANGLPNWQRAPPNWACPRRMRPRPSCRVSSCVCPMTHSGWARSHSWCVGLATAFRWTRTAPKPSPIRAALSSGLLKTGARASRPHPQAKSILAAAWVRHPIGDETLRHLCGMHMLGQPGLQEATALALLANPSTASDCPTPSSPPSPTATCAWRADFTPRVAPFCADPT